MIKLSKKRQNKLSQPLYKRWKVDEIKWCLEEICRSCQIIESKDEMKVTIEKAQANTDLWNSFVQMLWRIQTNINIEGKKMKKNSKQNNKVAPTNDVNRIIKIFELLKEVKNIVNMLDDERSKINITIVLNHLDSTLKDELNKAVYLKNKKGENTKDE